LTENQRSIWQLRLEGFRAADISRRMGKSRQYVSKSLQSSDSKIYRALAEAARMNKVLIRKMDPERGFVTGHSRDLGASVLLTFSPAEGINVWTPHKGQCEGCPDQAHCRSLLLREARRLGVEIPEEEMAPSLLAAYIYGNAWPETKEIFGEVEA
jgi:hypothetical protein